MARILDVYLYQHLVGQLIQGNSGQITFQYNQDWCNSSEAIALSQSLPLQAPTFDNRQSAAFFAGILPEENARKLIAKNLGISANNDFSMLERIGGECAGAVSFMPSGMTLPTQDYHYRKLSEEQLSQIIQQLPQNPLMAGADDVRLSLAGIQPKIAVHLQNDQISLPLNNAPSTHILKPPIPNFENTVINETWCMRLAQQLNIPTANTQIRNINGTDCLLVERYDRILDGGNKIHRCHQEDFCQALNITPRNKYQNEGGPSLSQCVDVLRIVSDNPAKDINCFIDIVIFNFLIGNHDAHGKNFSLLYPSGSKTRLAPFYDLLCTTYYPNLSKKMAMKLGNEYQSDKINSDHFKQFADQAKLSKVLVLERMQEIAEHLIDILIKTNHRNKTEQHLLKLAQTRTQYVLSRAF